MLVFRYSWFILIVCACATLAAPPMKQVFDLDDEAQLVQMFNDFKQEYKKSYHPSEHSKRFQLFVENLAEINVMNEQDPFAIYGNIEGQYALKHKELVDFSPQQLTSCDHFFANGCGGGDYSMAMMYLMLSDGLETEKDYPYTSGKGDTGICKFDKKKVKVTLANVNQYDFSTMTEDKVAELLVATGPLSIGLAAKPHLIAYDGGIISKDSCKDTEGKHAVLLVGYGEENGVPYWLVKNSWGAKKGEKGYFRMQRGVNCLNFMEAFGASAVVD